MSVFSLQEKMVAGKPRIGPLSNKFAGWRKVINSITYTHIYPKDGKSNET